MILVTGSSGFIGSHLLVELINNFGHDKIITLTSKPTKNCNYILHNNYNFNNTEFIDNKFEQIEVLIHAGAFTPKNGEMANHVQGSNSNIINTAALLNCRMPSLKKIILLSTLDVYEAADIISEETKTIPSTLYGWSKLYCEQMVANHAIQNEIIHQILRIGHVYGPGEEAYGKLIPRVIKAILNQESVHLYGSGNELRSFIYISDVIDAILKSIDLSTNIKPTNIVGSKAISVKDIIGTIIEFSETKVEVVKHDALTKSRDYLFDNSKMLNLLTQPKISYRIGIQNEWNYMKGL